METIHLSLLRGVCQMPAYVAYARSLFQKQGLNVRLNVAPTAWTVPECLMRGEVQFAVMPWTRVAAANVHDEPLTLICGSGCEEAAIVVRSGLPTEQVKKAALPQEGGIKDLTAMGLMRELGWEDIELIRQPSGDGAILSLIGQGADAAAMVEPYATMLTEQGIGSVAKRTGDLWPGAPGCSLTTTAAMIGRSPDVVQRMVNAFVEGARYVKSHPAQAAAIAANYIGIDSRFILKSLCHCQPNVAALENGESMDRIIALMRELSYIGKIPRDFYDRRFLKRASAESQIAAA